MALPVLPACGCVGSDGSVGLCPGGPTGPQVTVNVTGTWDAVVTVIDSTGVPTGTEFNATFTLTQSDTDVTGTFAAEGGVRGELTGGFFSNRRFSFHVAQDQPCPGNINGSANVLQSDTDAMEGGSYSSVDCGGRLDTRFVATRR